MARADLFESKNTLYLAKLRVEVKWRRRGVGSAIVKHIIQEYNKNIYLR
ncbi:GNAT family N-acetyltransferase [Allocoleopsis franciscana]